ncbi:2-dehydro-3-deoxygalactonokinase [Paracoccus seriniphilus]|uniref:2-dehydro-3-deoxygalactonokinase n=2 Tax=Paracoccus seriniphilus TaxID=184748 RepID=A0A239Q0T7_9RHOB|nr:2-dehydro-3-deoxygalactonokinase [Paracoccus seriniphilus]WCR15065.1 2-dehydro-3-deoxygalactonokinase [Paracoccus seriniphilus]SNT76124.1 2-dehydro-3-deoxygalactonokinase [Paracoccus seriniphilus]
MSKPEMIAVHCLSDHLKLWVMGSDGTLVAQRAGDSPASSDHAALQQAILRLLDGEIAHGQNLSVICCGHELGGAASVPCGIGAWEDAPYLPADQPGLSGITYLPGIVQQRPAARLSGEETAIAGFLIQNEKFDGVALCLTPAQSSWVHISASEAVSFRNFVTPQLSAALSPPMNAKAEADGIADDSDFLGAVEQAMTRPAAIAAEIGSIRAEMQLSALPADRARARLNGLLIGIELAAARPYWLGQQVAVIGDGPWTGLYSGALSAQGLQPRQVSSSAMTLAGMARAHMAKERGKTT